MAKDDFDWIDDAFDDKRTAEDMERAKGLSGCSGAAIAICIVCALTIVAVIALSGIVLASLQDLTGGTGI